MGKICKECRSIVDIINGEQYDGKTTRAEVGHKDTCSRKWRLPKGYRCECTAVVMPPWTYHDFGDGNIHRVAKAGGCDHLRKRREVAGQTNTALDNGLVKRPSARQPGLWARPKKEI